MTISAIQCRAARGLLGITQRELAERSGVGLRTIASFETEQRTPIRANLEAIRRTFEEAGVKFIPNGIEYPPIGSGKPWPPTRS